MDKIYSDEVRLVLERAQQGDRSVLPELRRCLSENPELWQSMGDLGAHVEQSIIELAAGASLLGQEAIRMKLAELKADLAEGRAIGPLEKLLIDRIAIAFLQATHGDLLENAKLRGGHAPAAPLGRLQDRAHQRFVSSVKMLAVIRKLLRPALLPVPFSTGGRRSA